jgi:HAD superfamily hydrolase (TIGR01509 family)
VLFVDDGGVLNDNRLRGPQWQRFVGEYFSPILGGSLQDWALANHQAIRSILAPSAWQARLEAAANFEDFERTYYIDWLGSTCDLVGVARPSDSELVDLAQKATKSILPRVQAAIPGAADTIRRLHRDGYPLYTASSGSSTELAGHLEGMGIADCFERLYGPDLVGAFKTGPEFYRRILTDSGVTPSEAVVIDDNPDAIAWATSVGMRCVQVGSMPVKSDDGLVNTIATLTELPALLEMLA